MAPKLNLKERGERRAQVCELLKEESQNNILFLASRTINRKEMENHIFFPLFSIRRGDVVIMLEVENELSRLKDNKLLYYSCVCVC